jgi:hypothetical protein
MDSSSQKKQSLWEPVLHDPIPERQAVICQLYDDFGICVACCRDPRLEAPAYAVRCPSTALAPLLYMAGITLWHNTVDFHLKGQGRLSATCFPNAETAYLGLEILYEVIYH